MTFAPVLFCSMDVKEQIDGLVKANSVVLFMKGTRRAPQCGFSATVVDILDDFIDEYETVNVLDDPAVRQGVKDYSAWPTIPQLYVKGEFVGGCDIIKEMNQNGELDEVLGATRGEVPIPELTFTDAAVAALLKYHEGEGAPTVRLEIDRHFRCGMDFDDANPGDILVDGPGVNVVLDRSSARRADGVSIDFIERADGAGFKIDNPNEPPRVKQLGVAELQAWLAAGKPLELFDVRPPAERALAALDAARPLDGEGKAILEALERDTVLVLHCHHGGRSQAAAEHCLKMGFKEVYNLRGGIDAWSQQVDPAVPRY